MPANDDLPKTIATMAIRCAGIGWRRAIQAAVFKLKAQGFDEAAKSVEALEGMTDDLTL